MADLSTKYMGLTLPSPLVLASSSLTNRVENFKIAEGHGAGAVVVRSLFEEQLEAAQSELDEAAAVGGDNNPEARSYLPFAKVGPREYLNLLKRAKKAVEIPVIASLNCSAPGSWSEYAKQIEEAGADALEVNCYFVAADPSVSGEEVEKKYLDVLTSVRRSVKIPIAFKLSPYFTALAHSALRFDRAGANALVLFNRFLQPDISVEKRSLLVSMPLSQPSEMLLSLRWIAILYGRVKADLAASTGVHDANGVIKQLLAGATVVQLAAALVKNGLPYLQTLRDGLEQWMDGEGHSCLEDFRGSLSQKGGLDPGAFERAQYVQLILAQN
ncbi:MAG: dihydroorotate dehydrogenase-like protein [Myxococcaceae bacterium]